MTRRGVFLLVPFVLLGLPASARATACFSNTSAAMPGVEGGAVAWGDYDNDGDLDALVTGFPSETDQEYMTRIFRNNGGTFTDIGVGVIGVSDGAVAWGDYDRDGDLDILISGVGCNGYFTRIYRNSGGADPFFTNAYANLPGLAKGGVAWGDYDNDGDLDIAISGEENGTQTPRAYVFRSSGGPNPTFTDMGAGLTGLTHGSVSWADYDKDGDLDLLITGNDAQVSEQTMTYRNNGGANPTFTQVGTFFFSRGDNSSADWGDYDNDGDLDVVITGGRGSNQNDARIFRQTSPGIFSQIATSFNPIDDGSVAWGDYNNDGKLDVLLIGMNTNGDPQSLIYQAPTFADAGVGLLPVGGLFGTNSGAAGAWGDVDNDGDLDVLLAGQGSPGLVTRVYRNDCGTFNSPPAAPTNLLASVNGTQITFSWAAASDTQTPSASLTYNLRVGTFPEGADIVSPEANPSTGYRRLPAMGNTNLRTSWTITVPGGHPYFWSVQAIDGSYIGGPFATEQSIGVTAVEQTLSLGTLLRIDGPNPLSKAVSISFEVPQEERVQIGVYDVAGRLVRALLNADKPAGPESMVWNGKDDDGQDVPSGLYLVRLHELTADAVSKVVVVH